MNSFDRVHLVRPITQGQIRKGHHSNNGHFSKIDKVHSVSSPWRKMDAEFAPKPQHVGERKNWMDYLF